MSQDPSGSARRTDRASRTSRREDRSWRHAEREASNRAEHPGWHVPPAVEQFAIEAPMLRAVTSHIGPEGARVVHVPSVHEFMHQKVVHDLRGLKEQAAIQADGAARRAAAPARALAADCESPIYSAYVARACRERRGKNSARLAREPSAQRAAHTACVAAISEEAEDAGGDGAGAHRGTAAGQ